MAIFNGYVSLPGGYLVKETLSRSFFANQWEKDIHVRFSCALRISALFFEYASWKPWGVSDLHYPLAGEHKPSYIPIICGLKPSD